MLLPIEPVSGPNKTQDDNRTAQCPECDRRAGLSRISIHRLPTLLAPGCNSDCKREKTAPVVYIVKRYRILIIGETPPIGAKGIGPEEIDPTLVQQLPLFRAQVFTAKVERCHHHGGKKDIADAPFQLITKQIDIFKVIVAEKVGHYKNE